MFQNRNSHSFSGMRWPKPRLKGIKGFVNKRRELRMNSRFKELRRKTEKRNRSIVFENRRIK